MLIALKDEAETAPQLAAAIRALDYPAGRLDLKLLIETGDEATRFALQRGRRANSSWCMTPRIVRIRIS